MDGDDLIFNSGAVSSGIRRDFHSQLWSYDSAGATVMNFNFSVGPVTNITNEGVSLDVAMTELVTGVPEPSILVGIASLLPFRRRRRSPLNC